MHNCHPSPPESASAYSTLNYGFLLVYKFFIEMHSGSTDILFPESCYLVAMLLSKPAAPFFTVPVFSQMLTVYMNIRIF